MTMSDRRSEIETWLIRWADCEAHTEGEVDITKLASKWRVRFRDARTGKWRTAYAPIRDTPPPPGFT
jgi:hypothetical protein